jgi:hypothetical protein
MSITALTPPALAHRFHTAIEVFSVTSTSAVRLFAAAITLTVLPSAIGGEIRVVDATVSVRNRLRPPTAGHFGSIGYKLPLRVTVDVISRAAGGDGVGLVDFTLTNVGKTALQLPISVHPRDLEPKDSNENYAVAVLGIYLTRGGGKGNVLPGRVDLYGSPKFPETMEELPPGASIRVITRMLSGPSDSAPVSSGVLRAHVVLEDQRVSTKGGETSEDTKEVGSAESDEFKLDSGSGPS